jgi:hypothetical protein
MNAAIRQNTPGRRADLNPWNVSATAEAPQTLLQLGNAARGIGRKDGPEASAEFGCVDWYLYHDQEGEDKTTH